VGVYHFFRFAKDGRKQARHFLKNAKMRKGDLVPVVDIEVWGNTLSTKPDKDVIIEIGRFLNEVELAVGHRPIIYTNRDTYNRYIKGQYENYPLWFCHLHDDPNSVAPRWVFWQYTHKGEISGAPHPIDFNVYRYSLADLKARFTIK
jgi:lysozyme